MGREKEALDKLHEEIREESEGKVKVIIDKIVNYYSEELDEIIDQIDRTAELIRNKEIDNYGEDELEADIIKLSTQMYYASREIAYLGGESDLAESKRKEKVNDVILNSSGTVQEKKAKAEDYSINEQTMEDIYKRAYKQLKNKLDQADKVYMSLKKVYSKKLKELEVFRKDLKGGEYDEL